MGKVKTRNVGLRRERMKRQVPYRRKRERVEAEGISKGGSRETWGKEGEREVQKSGIRHGEVEKIELLEKGDA